MLMVDFFHFIYSKHCDGPMSCDEERQSVAEFMRKSIIFCSTCIRRRRKKVHVRCLISWWVSFLYL